MDRLTELRNWLNNAPLGKKFPMEILHLEEGRAGVQLELSDNDMVVGDNGTLIAQGGIIAMIADTAAVLAAMSYIKEGHTPLVNINMDLCAATKPEDVRGCYVAIVC